MTITLAGIDRWDPDMITAVFEAAIARAHGTRAGRDVIDADGNPDGTELSWPFGNGDVARLPNAGQLQSTLEDFGMSPPGAEFVADRLSQGWSLEDVIAAVGSELGAEQDELNRVIDSTHISSHSPTWISEVDAQFLRTAAKRLGTAGYAIDGGLLLYDLNQGAPPGQRIGQFAGGAAGSGLVGLGTWAVVGSFIAGPEITAATVLIAALLGGAAGEKGGGLVGSLFDG